MADACMLATLESVIASGQPAGPQAVALPTGVDITAAMYLMQFDVTAFTHDDFAQAGIHRPDHIARSVHKRQAEYLAGRLCARACLAAYGCATDIGIGAHRQPLWPEGVIGSISHNARLAAAMVTRVDTCAGIGIDIETVLDPEMVACVHGLAVNDAEMRLLQAVSRGIRMEHLLTVIFSAKESFFKAAFLQVNDYFDFDAVQFQVIDLDRAILEFVVCEPLSTELSAGARFQATFHYLDPRTVMTVCVLGTHPGRE
jgi:enterobactin synthetase component D